MKLNFIAKTEDRTITSVEKIDRIVVEDGVVTAYFQVVVDGAVKDTFNVGREIGALSDEQRKALDALAVEAVAWLEQKRNPVQPEPVADPVTDPAVAEPEVIE
jgi:hypothetical protein